MKNARRAGGVHVADEPAPRHVAHDVLDRRERRGRVGLVVHRQEDAGDDLDHQHQQRQRAEEVPEVEVLRRVVLATCARCRAWMSGKRLSTQVISFWPAARRRALPSFSHATLLLWLRVPHRSIGRRAASGLLVFADQEPAVGQVHVRRHLEVVGRGLVLEDAAGHVEGRAVARAQEAAGPVVGQRGLRRRAELVARRAAEVRADADGDEELGLDRARIRCARTSGVSSSALRSDFGSASCGSIFGSAPAARACGARSRPACRATRPSSSRPA